MFCFSRLFSKKYFRVAGKRFEYFTGRYAARIGDSAAVSLASCLQYLVEELVDLVGIQAGQLNRSRIKPRHILPAVKRDEEFVELLKDVTIPESGWLCSYT